MKIEIEKIKAAMIENGIDEETIKTIISQLEEEAVEEIIPEPDNDVPTPDDIPDDNDSPKVKLEYVIVLHDKEGYLKDKEIAGWVVQQEENADAGLIVPKLIESAKDQNAGKKKNSITDLTNLFEYLKPKWLKEKHIKIKTKDLTRVIITNGKF